MARPSARDGCHAPRSTRRPARRLDILMPWPFLRGIGGRCRGYRRGGCFGGRQTGHALRTCPVDSTLHKVKRARLLSIRRAMNWLFLFLLACLWLVPIDFHREWRRSFPLPDGPSVNVIVTEYKVGAYRYAAVSASRLEPGVFSRNRFRNVQWSGYGVLLTMATTAMLLLCWRVSLRICERYQPKLGYCVSCGYRLTGLTTGTCPECGTVNDGASGVA